MNFKTISPVELNNHLPKVQSGEWNLIDVRSTEEYTSGHIPAAVLMTAGNTDQVVKSIQPDEVTILYCKTGKRSGAEARELSEIGFDRVYSLEGGINNWSSLGFPVTSGR